MNRLEEQVREWNRTHPVGTPVTRYRLIEPLREGSPTRTRSLAWIIGGHSIVAKVEGVAGGVLIESLVDR